MVEENSAFTVYLQTEGTWFFYCGIITGEAAEFYSLLYHRMLRKLFYCEAPEMLCGLRLHLTLTDMQEEMMSFSVWVNSYSMSHTSCRE